MNKASHHPYPLPPIEPDASIKPPAAPVVEGMCVKESDVPGMDFMARVESFRRRIAAKTVYRNKEIA